jgi:hypothetical protein
VSARPAPVVAMDGLTLARKEGWRAFATAAPRARPEHLPRRRLDQLSEQALAQYNTARAIWHANIGPLRTPQLAELHEQLWDILESNRQDGDKAKGAVALDALPGLGKTTAVLAFAKAFHQRAMREGGELTAAGHEHWPVVRVGLTGNTRMKDFNAAILEFFGHPGWRNGTSGQLGQRALDCITSCNTRLLIIDDLHFLRWRYRNGIEISNHFKYVANEFPLTLLFVGVGLAEQAWLSEGHAGSEAVLAQTARRTTMLGLDPFLAQDEAQRRTWRALLLAIEERLVLADTYPGMLADALAEYLFARSSGHFGSLMTLINRGCQRAVRLGHERLDADLLDRVQIDAASEQARAELQAALASGRLKVRPKRAVAR